MNVDALVAPLRADVVSGAAAVGRTAADAVSRAVERAPREGLDAFRGLLQELAVRILDAQPAMAPLVALSADVLTLVEEADTEAEARAGVQDVAREFRRRLWDAGREVADAARELIPAGATVLTVSASSTVRAALTGGDEPPELEVICLESRPMTEGRRMARQLADSGIPVLFAVDAAAFSLVDRADLVLLGADSVGDRGVVNKIGSAAAATAARRAGIPVHVLADRTKLLPTGFPQPLDDDRPEEEVWRSPAGIRVWNRYFESFPVEEISGVVTEDGILAPPAVRRARERIAVPERLRRWAAERPAGG